MYDKINILWWHSIFEIHLHSFKKIISKTYCNIFVKLTTQSIRQEEDWIGINIWINHDFNKYTTWGNETKNRNLYKKIYQVNYKYIKAASSNKKSSEAACKNNKT